MFGSLCGAGETRYPARGRRGRLPRTIGDLYKQSGKVAFSGPVIKRKSTSVMISPKVM
jgi:hypothetical protein